MRRLLLLGVPGIAFHVATVQAQSEPEGAHIEEVIVTAQKREQSMQDVPITVNAITSSQLERTGVSSSRDLAQVTPGLVITTAAVVTQPVIRGVGARGVGAGDEGTVPIYIDGVYSSVQHAGTFDLSSIERIEVLKGPQGTLFGRNAVGGAINVITKDPSQNFSGSASASYASYDQRKGEVYLTGPLTDTLAANLSVYGAEDDGYIDDRLNGGKINPSSATVVRGKLLWAPSEATEVKLTGHHTYTNDVTGIAVHPLDGVTAGRNYTPPVIIAGDYEAALNTAPINKTTTDGASLTARHSFAAFDLNALVSYQETENLTRSDSDASPAPLAFLDFELGDETYTGELRAASNTDSALQWIAGLYYFDATSCYCRFNSGNTLFLQATQTSDAYAAFGEATYAFNDRISTTLGVRYSYEEREITTLRNGVLLGRASDDFSKVSPRASVTYAFDERTRVYFTYSQGFKSGVYNASSTALPLTAVKPEVLDAFEIGLKSEPSNRLRTNLSLYYYDHSDLQVSSRSPTTNATVLQNAASSEIYGMEAQLDFAVTTDFNLSAGLAYTHAEFAEFELANLLTPRPDRAGNISSFGDVSGNFIPRSPEYTFTLRGDYTVPLAAGELTFAGNVYASSEYFWDFQNRIVTDDFVTLNASVSWASPGDTYRVTLFGDNLTDDGRFMSVSSTATADYGAQVRPRSVGVKVQYKF